jgi:hypothetical protein
MSLDMYEVFTQCILYRAAKHVDVSLGGTKLMMLFFLKTLSQGLRKNKGLLTVK